MELTGRTIPALLAVPVLALAVMLPWQAGWVCAVAVIVVLGVPHGALDVEIGRTLLRGRVGRWWFPMFALPYLLLSGAVLLAWRWVPDATLAAFLAASVWHFGTEDTGGDGLPALAMGGLPVAVPVLAQPSATAAVLSAACGQVMDGPPGWLVAASLAWLVPLGLLMLHRRGTASVKPALLCGVFVALPPLLAFALYFVVVHAPAHVAATIRNPTRAPRVHDAASAWRLAWPTTLLTVLIGAALWPAYAGAAPVRLVQITLQLLAALTLPHMLLDAWLDRRERVGTSVRSWRPHRHGHRLPAT